jgi:hypothetical protein
MDAGQWRLAATAAGVKSPSPATVEMIVAQLTAAERPSADPFHGF